MRFLSIVALFGLASATYISPNLLVSPDKPIHVRADAALSLGTLDLEALLRLVLKVHPAALARAKLALPGILALEEVPPVIHVRQTRTPTPAGFVPTVPPAPPPAPDPEIARC
ncbi:hypothetical protein RhiJN_18371 [Ceratobasidium sp. AG-Ba]|nr:hypothetical protein RhiJN_18371 [Ceratobasidium sp. AG-Ba]